MLSILKEHERIGFGNCGTDKFREPSTIFRGFQWSSMRPFGRNAGKACQKQSNSEKLNQDTQKSNNIFSGHTRFLVIHDASAQPDWLLI